ncbi:hypothetical protein Tco_1084995, partial [Tanacetum coccineum]
MSCLLSISVFMPAVDMSCLLFGALVDMACLLSISAFEPATFVDMSLVAFIYTCFIIAGYENGDVKMEILNGNTIISALLYFLFLLLLYNVLLLSVDLILNGLARSTRRIMKKVDLVVPVMIVTPFGEGDAGKK